MRLAGYDYPQAGAYFVTVCTQDRACLFGEVVDGEMRLNPSGQAVASVWQALPEHYAHVLDTPASPRHGLSEVVRGFKTFSARRVNELRKARGVAVWQRSFHDQVIGDTAFLCEVRKYIAANSFEWPNDSDHPVSTPYRRHGDMRGGVAVGSRRSGVPGHGGVIPTRLYGV